MTEQTTRSARPLDRQAVEDLTHSLLLKVRNHYLNRPVSRATAQEVLNALAIAAAMIIAGAGASGAAEARAFFDQALDQQLNDMPIEEGS